MFFKPKQVTSWRTQWDKWFSAYLFQFTFLPPIILFNNFWFFFTDLFTITDPNKLGTYPSMYNNWFTELFMQDPSNIWGAFEYYDLFTFNGWLNWYLDTLMLNYFWWIEIIKGIIRYSIPDWTYDTPESRNFIDMNRLFASDLDANPFDKEYWENRDG